MAEHSLGLTTSGRTRKPVDERRMELLSRGVELFNARPYDEVSIADIAREAGVSKGLLYHYFGGKRPFYLECVRVTADQLLEMTQDDPSLPEARRAEAALSAYLDFVEGRATAYVALMRSGIGNDPEVAKVLDETRATFVDRMLAGMGFTAPRPVFRMAARCWIRQVEGACLEWLESRDVDRATLVQLLLGSLFGTMAAAKLLDPNAPFELPATVHALALFDKSKG